MRKVKLDAKKAAGLHEEKTVTILDKEITVRTHIPYEEKLKLAEELTNYVAIMDDEQTIAVQSHIKSACEALMLFRYYTNVDSEKLTPANAHDLLVNTDSYDAVLGICEADFNESLDIAYNMVENIIAIMDKRKSVGYAVMKSFGSILNGGDFVDTMLDGSELREELMDSLDKIRQAGKAEEGKVENGKIKLGGAVIDIAKKE